MTDTLQELLNAQSELQKKMPTPHPIDLYNDLTADYSGSTLRDQAVNQITEFIQWNHKALLHEMVELEQETGWKPWATKSFVNIEAARGEAIDMLHFLLNDFLVLGLDSHEIIRRYRAKHATNVKRQEEGYDGVSTKCPGCNRALDDDAVACHRTRGRLGSDEYQVGVFCESRGRFYPDQDGKPGPRTIATLSTPPPPRYPTPYSTIPAPTPFGYGTHQEGQFE